MKIKVQIDELVEKIDRLRLELEQEANKMNLVSPFVNQFANLAFEADKLDNPSLNIEEFNEKLSGLLSAVELGDFDLFADQMEFEMKPLLEHWKSLI